MLARMATHPEEFYGDNNKWKFIYKEYFRDAMSEAEKGMIFDRIKEIRKEEFTLAVMQTMTADEKEDDLDNPFGSTTIKGLKAQQLLMIQNRYKPYR